MGMMLVLIIIFFIIIAVAGFFIPDTERQRPPLDREPYYKEEPRYTYIKRDSIATPAEQDFFHRLVEVTKGKYLVFPQIHLSSLAVNKTFGQYRKAGFWRINRRSVDYILADRRTLAPIYAVELDDSSHDTPKARAVDDLKEQILHQIGIPLVRFRNVKYLTNEQIIERFKESIEHD